MTEASEMDAKLLKVTQDNQTNKQKSQGKPTATTDSPLIENVPRCWQPQHRLTKRSWALSKSCVAFMEQRERKQFSHSRKQKGKPSVSFSGSGEDTVCGWKEIE